MIVCFNLKIIYFATNIIFLQLANSLNSSLLITSTVVGIDMFLSFVKWHSNYFFFELNTHLINTN